MKKFARLIEVLATSTKTNPRLEALQEYFTTAGSEDRVWVIALFTGRKPKRSVSGALLASWCIEIADIPDWLFAECYHTVGDLAETISLLLPEPVVTEEDTGLPLHHYLNILLQLEKQDEIIKRKYITESWLELSTVGRFIFNKFITGGFRIGVSQKMIVNALARTTGLSSSVIAHRILGKWDPSSITFDELLGDDTATDFSKPYPFYLSYPIEEDVTLLGDTFLWQAEWKWDGIRGQIIKRNNELFVWSRGEELVTEKFPEFSILQKLLPEGVALDGEILSLVPADNAEGFKALPFALLQTRIGRKNISKKELTEAPVGFVIYDLLEVNGTDIREQPMEARRKQLEELFASVQQPFFHLSPIIDFKDWEDLKALRLRSRDLGSEGIMLKLKSSSYEVGRKRGSWWKWKIDPLTIDAVLVYAQKGSGRRSNLYTDYTFAVRDGEKLVTFTKAYSGLTDKEIGQVDAFVKRNSIEKFGPVRTVKPELVFEIAFEGIAASNRHKSGVALRFPRMKRWRKDKKADEINTLDDLKEILNNYNNPDGKNQ